jgi:hypothetical protein
MRIPIGWADDGCNVENIVIILADAEGETVITDFNTLDIYDYLITYLFLLFIYNISYRMNWIYLSLLHSILVVSLILYIRYDNTPQFIFPIVVSIIVGAMSLAYFMFYYREHFATEFVKPKYYIYAILFLFVSILAYYIIKICPNPAYFRLFATLEIILLFIITLYIHKDYFNVSIQSLAGLIFGCLAIILISLDEANHTDLQKI